MTNNQMFEIRSILENMNADELEEAKKVLELLCTMSAEERVKFAEKVEQLTN